MKEVLVLNDLDCIKAITHPKRIDILKLFEDLPLSAKQISHMLEEPHAKINYHVKTLYKIGILELVEQKIKSGIVEKYYYPKAKYIVINKKFLTFSGKSTRPIEENVHISQFENISNLFYKAMESDSINKNNIVEYEDLYLTKDEFGDLMSTINTKLEKIKLNRKVNDEEQSYSLSIINIPKDEEFSTNI